MSERLSAVGCRLSVCGWLLIARWSWRELLLYGVPLLALTIGVGLLGLSWRWAAVFPASALLLLVWFFRDPPRTIPNDPDGYLAPADGRVVAVTPVDHDEFLGSPAISIGIFLSLLDVHINRVPRAARVIATRHRPGEHRSALDPASADQNESQRTDFEGREGRRYAVRQIAGLLARRIVCDAQPGDEVEAGHKFGMIKFGSRTELIVPADVEVVCRVGDRVKAGVTVLAREGGDG